MHRPHAPTVRPLLPVRRVLAGAPAVGAVAVVAPAAANAGVSTCNCSASKTLNVTDLSGSAALRLVRGGDQIRIADGKAGTNFCPVPGSPLEVANVTNTDTIQVFRDARSPTRATIR